MRLFRRGFLSGRLLTATAAALVALMGVLPNVWPELFGIGPHGRAPGQGKLLAYLVMAAALLTRWRPMRWLVIFSMIPLVAMAFVRREGLFANPGWAIEGWTAIAILAILASPPVSRYFRQRHSEWGDDEPPPPERPDRAERMLPLVKMEADAMARAAGARAAPDHAERGPS